MAKGTAIIVSNQPRGVFIEGWITGTPKPGTCMEIDISEAAVGGRFTWEAYGASSGAIGSDGDRQLIAVLLPDDLIGQLATTAYATGERGFMYCPVAGEEINIIVEDVGGTGDDIAVGDKFLVDDGTGKLILTTGTPESEPFIALEAATDPQADTLLHCMYTGY